LPYRDVQHKPIESAVKRKSANMLDVRCARRRTGAASSKNAKHKTYPRARLVNQTPKRLGLPKDRAARCAAGRAATPPRRRDRKPPEPSCLAAVCGSASWWSWSWRPGPGQAGGISGPVAGGAQNRRWRCVPGVAAAVLPWSLSVQSPPLALDQPPKPRSTHARGSTPAPAEEAGSYELCVPCKL
jgi:hypothetical protein